MDVEERLTIIIMFYGGSHKINAKLNLGLTAIAKLRVF